MSDIKVSVIMPVYNTELAKLNRAVNSILSQSLKEMELLLIDDGSKASVARACDVFATKDGRVHVVHQKNSGLCAARNKGLVLAQGRYVAFSDHDDEFCDDLLLDNYLLGEKYQADIIKFGYKFVCLDGGPRFPFASFYAIDRATVIADKNISQWYSYLKDCGILNFIWDGLYRRSWLKKHGLFFNIKFIYGQEDIDFCNQAYANIGKLVYNNNAYYIHYRYANSTSRGMDKKRSIRLINDEIYVYKREVDFIKKWACGEEKNICINDVKLRTLLVLLSTVLREDFYGNINDKIKSLDQLRHVMMYEGQMIMDGKWPIHKRICAWLFMRNWLKVMVVLAGCYVHYCYIRKTFQT